MEQRKKRVPTREPPETMQRLMKAALLLALLDFSLDAHAALLLSEVGSDEGSSAPPQARRDPPATLLSLPTPIYRSRGMR